MKAALQRLRTALMISRQIDHLSRLERLYLYEKSFPVDESSPEYPRHLAKMWAIGQEGAARTRLVQALHKRERRLAE